MAGAVDVEAQAAALIARAQAAGYTRDSTEALMRPGERAQGRRLPGWLRLAACEDTADEAWFGSTSAQRELVERYCSWCPVRAECADAAERWEATEGVWGGKVAVELVASRREQPASTPECARGCGRPAGRRTGMCRSCAARARRGKAGPAARRGTVTV